MFNLTKRQLICFTGGALIGVPLFFLLRKPTGNSVAAMCMMPVSYTHLDVYKRQFQTRINQGFFGGCQRVRDTFSLFP